MRGATGSNCRVLPGCNAKGYSENVATGRPRIIDHAPSIWLNIMRILENLAQDVEIKRFCLGSGSRGFTGDTHRYQVERYCIEIGSLARSLIRSFRIFTPP